MSKIALIDLDSTIVHTTEGWLKVLNSEFNKQITLADLKDWETIVTVFPKKRAYQILDSPYFYQEYVRPIKGSFEFLQELKVLGYTVNLLTASNKNDSKIEYVHDYFPNIFSDLIFDNEKYKHKGDIIVDDNFKHVYEHVNNNDSLGFLYLHHGKYLYSDVRWRNRNFHRVMDYESILKKLKEN